MLVMICRQLRVLLWWACHWLQTIDTVWDQENATRPVQQVWVRVPTAVAHSKRPSPTPEQWSVAQVIDKSAWLQPATQGSDPRAQLNSPLTGHSDVVQTQKAFVGVS